MLAENDRVSNTTKKILISQQISSPLTYNTYEHLRCTSVLRFVLRLMYLISADYMLKDNYFIILTLFLSYGDTLTFVRTRNFLARDTQRFV